MKTKTALVTGASSGIGEAAAQGLFAGVAIAMRARGTDQSPTSPERRRKYVSLIAAQRSLAGWIILASLALQLLGVALPALTTFVIDRVIPSSELSGLQLALLGLGVLVGARVSTLVVRSLLMTELQCRVEQDLGSRLVTHLVSLPLRFFERRASGDLPHRLSSTIAVRDMLAGQMVMFVLDAAAVLFYLLVILSVNVAFAGIVLAVGVLQLAARLSPSVGSGASIDPQPPPSGGMSGTRWMRS